jgi:hypothetical protein
MGTVQNPVIIDVNCLVCLAFISRQTSLVASAKLLYFYLLYLLWRIDLLLGKDLEANTGIAAAIQ